MELKDMAVDIGASSDEEAAEMGVRPGQWIAAEGTFFSMKNKKILAGKAFDDRAGCALMIETIKESDGFPCTIYGAATVQEEVGLRGARTAAEIVDPDVCIVLEGSPAADAFGNNGSDRQGVLGEGVQIRLFDPTMIPNPGLRDFMLDVAESEEIPYQVLVRDAGGTDAGQIHLHGHGVPTIVLAVPVRYAHSPTGLIHADDYDNTLALVKAAVMRLDAATVASFVA
jgi:endoglucanase